jgi:glycosyltransferase involved in cell wall biosynthesis
MAGQGFDAAFIWNVLDYVPDPVKTCALVRSTLKENAFVGLQSRDSKSVRNKSKRINLYQSGHRNFLGRIEQARVFQEVFGERPTSVMFDKYGDSGVVSFARISNEPFNQADIKPLVCVHPFLFSKLDDATGPRGRVLNTVGHLRTMNCTADISLSLKPEARGYDIVHIFHNSWEPQDGLSQLTYSKQYGAKVVISTIYMDMSETRFIDQNLGKIFQGLNKSGMERRLATLAKGNLKSGRLYGQEMVNYHTWRLADDQRALFEMSDRLLCFSYTEARQISLNLGLSMPYSIVNNSANQDVFGHYGPEDFLEHYGVKDFVIAAGHLEFRKNQLMMLYAMRDYPEIPIVVVGAQGNEEYSELCRSWAHKNTVFIPQMKHRHLASAFAAGKVHAQVSWIEGIALSSIEAAMSGCTPVVADRAGEIEYYSEHGGYANPGSVESIKNSILKAWHSNTPSSREKTKAYMQGRYTFEKAASQTLSAYRKTLADSGVEL